MMNDGRRLTMRQRYRRLRGKKDYWSWTYRKALRWYLGWNERYWVEGELGRQPIIGAIRESWLEDDQLKTKQGVINGRR